MKKKINAKQKIIDAAADLFHEQGVQATSVDDILAKSATGKGQFYHYFENKDDLVHHVMQHFFSMLKSGEIPLIRDLKTWKDLETWFLFFVEAQKGMNCQRSCPIGTIASELRDDQKLLRKDACDIFDYANQPLVEFFQRMRKAGKISKSQDPEALADFCYTIMQGGLLMSKIQRNITPFENSVQHALKYIRTMQRE